MMQMLRLVLTISICGLFAACMESPTKIESDLGIKGAPDWVNEGTQAVNDKSGRLIHGMGSSQALGNEALQRSTADTRARAEIARVVSSYLDVTMRDFTQAQTATQADSQSSAAVSSDIQQEIRSASNVVINGSKIVGRWKDQRTGVIYSFAELDLKKLDKAISMAEKLSQNFKAYYDSNNNTVFDQFVEENN